MSVRLECQDCGEYCDQYDAKEIQHIHDRVAPGEPMPWGECPKCGALLQPQKPHSLFTVTFIAWEEGDEAGLAKWLANYTDGMDILHAGFEEPDHADMETIIDSNWED